MALERKLYVGIPQGSLNDNRENRGWTQLLLKHAGWELEGYAPLNVQSYPKIISGDSEVKFVCMRPRAMPYFLKKGHLDMVLCGEDIVREHFAKALFLDLERDLTYHYLENANPKNKRYKEIYEAYMHAISNGNFKLNISKNADPENNSIFVPDFRTGKQIEKIADLGLGKVSLYFGLTEGLKDFIKYKDKKGKSRFLGEIINSYKYTPLNVVTDYPFLAYFALAKDINPPQIGISGLKRYRVTGGKNVDIIEANGTEVFLSSNVGHMVLDSVSTGQHFKSHGLITVGKPVVTSTMGVYVRQDFCRTGPAYVKYELKSKLNDKTMLEQQSNNDLKKELKIEKENNTQWIGDKIKEVTEKLKSAAVKYGEQGLDGKGRKDSIYYLGEKA